MDDNHHTEIKEIKTIENTNDDSAIKDGEMKKEVLTTNVEHDEDEVKVQDEVVVHATAIFDGSPTCGMTQADADFIEGIVFGQNYLKENISRL